MPREILGRRTAGRTRRRSMVRARRCGFAARNAPRRRLSGGLTRLAVRWITAHSLCLVFAAAPCHAENDLLLTHDGGTLRGDIRREGDRWVVRRRDQSQISVPAYRVSRVGAVSELYHHQRRVISETNAARRDWRPHAALCRWCRRWDYRAGHAEQLDWVRRRGGPSVVIDQLSAGKVAPSTSSAAATDPGPAPETPNPTPVAVRPLPRGLSTLLQNRCANCHQASEWNNLVRHPTIEEYATRAHGGSSRPPIRNGSTTLRRWRSELAAVGRPMNVADSPSPVDSRLRPVTWVPDLQPPPRDTPDIGATDVEPSVAPEAASGAGDAIRRLVRPPPRTGDDFNRLPAGR